MDSALDEGPLKHITVNQRVIVTNRTRGHREPPIVVHTEDGDIHATDIEIQGPSSVTYRPEAPAPSGATVWIETRSKVVILA